MVLNTNLHGNYSHLWTIPVESFSPKSPKYFNHKIKFQDIQARNWCTFLTARVALHSFSTTENYLENHLHKVCKRCQSDRRKRARPQRPRPLPSALPQPWALQVSLRVPLSRRRQGATRGPAWQPRGGLSQALPSAVSVSPHQSPSWAVGAQMSLELLRNWMRTRYTNVYWHSVCTIIILCCLSMSSPLGMSSTSLCSRQAIMISDRMTTPVLPTPALQWTSNGGLGLFGSLVLFVWRRTDWISSRYAMKYQWNREIG